MLSSHCGSTFGISSHVPRWHEGWGKPCVAILIVAVAVGGGGGVRIRTVTLSRIDPTAEGHSSHSEASHK